METHNSVILFKSEKEGSGDRYAEMLTQGGFEAECIPVLAFEFINIDKLCMALQCPLNYWGVVLTSPRAVEAMRMACEKIDMATQGEYNSKTAAELPDSSEGTGRIQSKSSSSSEEPSKKRLKMESLTGGISCRWSGVAVYVIGKATRDAAAKLGFETKGEESGNAEQLAEIIVQDKSQENKSLLFPCGNLRKETLPKKLAKNGIQLDSITVYQTGPAKNIKRNLLHFVKDKGIPHHLVFFSPSGVQFTKDIIEDLKLPVGKIKLVAIGPSTKEELERQGYTVFAEAIKPSPESVLTAVTG